MPELAEVELARRIWEPGQGQEVIAVESHPETRVYRDTPAGEIQTHLTRKMMVDSRTHGKRLLFGFQILSQNPRLEALSSIWKFTLECPVAYSLQIHIIARTNTTILF